MRASQPHPSPADGDRVSYLVPERKVRIDEVVANRTRTLTVVMEAFCDPQNVNAVVRTCEAFGIQEDRKSVV